MENIRLIKRELDRMCEKRNTICIELGSGYDWMLVNSLIAIDGKIKQYEKKLDEVLKNEI